jgi:uncharacterized membrane protein YbhN (UPF0104 family)
MNNDSIETAQVGPATVPPKSVKAVLLSIQLGLGAVMLWWVSAQTNLDAKKIIRLFSEVSILPLVLAVAFFIVSMILKGLQYSVLLPPSTSKIYLTSVALLQNALLTFLPWRAGEMSFPFLLHKDYRTPIATGVSMLAVIRLVDLLVVVLVTLVGSQRLGWDIGWAGIILGASLICVFFICLKFARRQIWTPVFLKTFIAGFEPLGHIFQLGCLLLLSVGVFITTMFQAIFALQAMGLPITIPDGAVLNAISLAAAVLPIHPPGGWGTIDSVQSLVLQRLRYRPEISVPVIIGAHCFYTILILTGGAIGCLVRGRVCRR